MHVKTMSRSSLFFTNLALDELWCQYFIEETYLTAAYRYILYKSHKPQAEHEEAMAVCEPNWDPCFVTDPVRHFASVFSSAETRWVSVASQLEFVDFINHDAFRKQVVQDVRYEFLASPIRQAEYVQDLLNTYRLAIDQFIEYHFKVYNTYLEDWSEEVRRTGGISLFDEYLKIAYNPHELSITGDPNSFENPSAAAWVEYHPPRDDMIGYQIFQALYQIDTLIEGVFAEHMLFTIKNKLLLKIALLFYPQVHFSEIAYPLSAIEQLIVPQPYTFTFCSEDDHDFVPSSNLELDLVYCSRCGQSRCIDDFTEEEVDEILLKIETMLTDMTEGAN
jgi:hypothetical protein